MRIGAWWAVINTELHLTFAILKNVAQFLHNQSLCPIELKMEAKLIFRKATQIQLGMLGKRVISIELKNRSRALTGWRSWCQMQSNNNVRKGWFLRGRSGRKAGELSAISTEMWEMFKCIELCWAPKELTEGDFRKYNSLVEYSHF